MRPSLLLCLPLLLTLAACGGAGDGDTSTADTAAADSGTDTAPDTGDSGATTDTGADLARGAEVYRTSCGSGYCHGPDGVSGPAPDHTTAVPALDDAALVDVIQNGTGYMSPVGLDADDLVDVVGYLRATFP